MLQLNTDTFKTEIEEGKGWAFVDFFTTSCGPCRAIAPVLTRQEEKHKNVKFAKIEAGDGHDQFVKYDVRYVPTLIIFRDGKEVDRKGFMSEKDLEKWLTTTAKESTTKTEETNTSE